MVMGTASPSLPSRRCCLVALTLRCWYWQGGRVTRPCISSLQRIVMKMILTSILPRLLSMLFLSCPSHLYRHCHCSIVHIFIHIRDIYLFPSSPLLTSPPFPFPSLVFPFFYYCFIVHAFLPFNKFYKPFVHQLIFRFCETALRRQTNDVFSISVIPVKGTYSSPSIKNANTPEY